MKRIRFILFVLMAWVILPLTAKSQDLILGQWEMDRNSLEMDMRAEDKETFSKLPNQKRGEVIQKLGSRKFEFSEGGDFRAEWIAKGQNQNMVGKWEVKGDQLLIDTRDGIKSYRILVSNKKKLVLVPNAKVGFFQKLVFNKSE